jgi:hypothetical protein
MEHELKDIHVRLQGDDVEVLVNQAAHPLQNCLVIVSEQHWNFADSFSAFRGAN